MIQIIKATGHGSTYKSAFDGALEDAGIHDYNIINLSSVIPYAWKVERKERYKASESEHNKHGNRLYTVMAKNESAINEPIYSGIGWAISGNKGWFVEHVGSSYSNVEIAIKQSLKEMMDRRNIDKYTTDYVIHGKENDKETSLGIVTCVMVVAVYQDDEWQ